MSVNAAQAIRNNRRWSWPGRFALLLGGWSLLVLLSVVLAVALSRYPLSLTVGLGGGVLLLGAMAIVVTRYDLAVTIGFLLLAVVLVEPAPSDALFALIIVVSIITGRFALRRLPMFARVVVASFVVLNLVSMVDVLDWSVAARFFVTTLFLGAFSLWLCAYIDRPARARRLVRAYLAAAVLSALAASAALFVHFPAFTVLIGDGERAKGLFKDPNVFGPFLVPIALILAEEILRPRLLRMRRSLMLACFLALTLGVLFSYSRAAWLNYVLSLIVLIAVVVLRRPDRRAISLVLVVLVSGAAMAGTIVASGSLSFLQERAHVQNYDSSRFAAQTRGLEAGLQHPLGLGPGQFDVVSPVSSHSLYVRSLAEQGALGLLIIVALLAGTLVLAVVNVMRGRDTQGISAAALLAAWCGLIVNSFFVDTMHWRHLWLIAALIWAAVAVPRSKQD
jgi:O-antigen ligase